MQKDIKEMQKRALEIRNQYAKSDPRQWGADQVFMGMMKDVGDLSKLMMIKGGYRDEYSEETKKAVEHELSDILYCIFVLAEKLEVDLEESFSRTMDELEKRIGGKQVSVD